MPILSREEWIKSGELQGLSLRDVVLTVWNPKGKKVISHRGDMIFTHFGLSGPIALRCSQFLRQVQRKSGTDTVEMSIDLFPDLNAQEVESMLQDKLDQEPKKAIRNSLKGLLPERLIPLLLTKAELDGDTIGHHVSKNGLLLLAGILKRMPVYVHGTRSLSEAFVTAWWGKSEGDRSQKNGIEAYAGVILLRRGTRYPWLYRRLQYNSGLLNRIYSRQTRR